EASSCWIARAGRGPPQSPASVPLRSGRPSRCESSAPAGRDRLTDPAPLALAPAEEDAVIGGGGGFRYAPRDQRGLENRIGEAHRRARAAGTRRRGGRGPRPGGARRGTRAVAGV